MSESETRVREALRDLYAHEDPEKWHTAREALKALDTLLAEHRAEVARLTRQRDETVEHAKEERKRATSARDAALEEAALAAHGVRDEFGSVSDRIRALKSAPAPEPTMPPCPFCGERPCRLCEDCEALATLHWQQGDDAPVAQSVSARDAALEEGAAEMERINEARAAIRLRALKSAPVAVLPADRVREVFLSLQEEVLASDMAAIAEAARRLGVPLDADGRGES